MFNHRTLSSHIILISFLFLALIGVFSPIRADAEQPINIIMNGRRIETDASPVLRNGRIFIPARTISGALMMNIEFNSQRQTIAIWNNHKQISFAIGSNRAFLFVFPSHGKYETILLDAPSFIHNGRTMIPLRFVSEIFGLDVSWSSETRTVTISSPRPVLPVKATAYLPPTQMNPERRKMSPEEVIALIEPATVQIQLIQNAVRGSGFVISPEGLVITNAHVARGVKNLYVAFKNGEHFPVQLLKLNNRSDLALLRILAEPGRTFPYVKYRAYRNSVLIGDTVLSFGNPDDKQWVVSQGTVIDIFTIPLASAWTKEYPLIMHDAPTGRGSSGGILANLYGEWIGVNALGGVYEQFGFAVPMDYLYELVDGSYFNLICDWESYWTESFTWRSELLRAKKYFDKALDAQGGSQKQADAWRKSLKIVQNIRFFPSMHEPLFPELFYLPGLFVRKTDALIAYYTYHLDVLEGRMVFSQDEKNRLWDNVERAKSQYIAEHNRVRAAVDPEDTYKASLP